MRKFLKKYGGILYIIIATLVVVLVLLYSDELPGVISTIKELDVRYVWAAGGCMAAYIVFRVLTLRYYLRREGARIGIFNSIIVTLIGQFYSAITPSSSGGQPMQVLTMYEMGVPVSVGTATVSVKFIGFQLSFMLVGAVLWIAQRGFVGAQLGGVVWLVLLGFVINMTLIVAVVLTMFKSDWVDRLLNFCVNLCAKLRIVRDKERALDNARGILGDYRASFSRLMRRPADALVVFALSLMQVLSYMSVIVCLYHAFGLTGHTTGQLMALQLLLFITAAFVPLPGAAGAQEGGFYLFFRGVFPESSVLAVMLCWRFFTYYALLLAGLAGVIAHAIRGLIGRRRGARDDGDA